MNDGFAGVDDSEGDGEGNNIGDSGIPMMGVKDDSVGNGVGTMGKYCDIVLEVILGAEVGTVS